MRQLLSTRARPLPGGSASRDVFSLCAITSERAADGPGGAACVGALPAAWPEAGRHPLALAARPIQHTKIASGLNRIETKLVHGVVGESAWIRLGVPRLDGARAIRCPRKQPLRSGRGYADLGFEAAPGVR